jgi:hypothetical protein
MPTVVRPETFAPTLLTSEPLVVSGEQQRYIREILEIGASDSKFASKMYDAIWRVLTGGSATPPVISSLNPSTVAVGSPDFDLHVVGTGFTPESKILFAGVEEPTTLVSPTELKTGVMMSLWVGPDAVPVSVLNNGVMSDPMEFVFTDVAAFSAPAKKTTAEEHHHKAGK